MTPSTTSPRLVLAVILGFVLAACGTEDRSSPPEDTAAAPEATGMAGMPDHDMGAMQMDPGMVRRHAEEADSVVTAMRTHVQQMRQLPPAEWQARMAEHTSAVGGMFSMMDRHMSEMGMSMGMDDHPDDHHMGQMMGMTADEHRRMREEMQALRAEAEQLRAASQSDVRERMPTHLDRLEGVLRTMEQHIAHMRSM